MRVTPVGVATAVRAGYGLNLACRPDPVVRLFAGRPADPAARRVARLLGARHVVQALASAGSPDRAVLVLGAEADVLHAITAVGLALVDSSRRRAGFIDALAAGSFGAASLLLARRAGSDPSSLADGRARPALAVLRARLAARIARITVPAGLLAGGAG